MDETFGIQTSQVEIAKEILSTSYKPEPGQPTTEIRRLNNEDIIFKEIRSKPYEAMGFYITEKIREFEQATDKNQNKNADLKQLEAAVKRIKEMNIPVAKPLCDLHNNIGFYIKE